MSLVSTFFSSCLSSRLDADEVHLPLDPASAADLLNILAEPGSYTYLTISCERTLETVKVTNVQGALILERGLEGTVPVLHRFGSTVSTVSPTVLTVIKDLVCNYQCCESECPCQPVEFVGAVLPTGKVGFVWKGSVVFSGSLPMQLVINGTPSWMEVVQQGNSLVLSGVPDMDMNYSLSVAATNCNGTEITTQLVFFTVEM